MYVNINTWHFVNRIIIPDDIHRFSILFPLRLSDNNPSISIIHPTKIDLQKQIITQGILKVRTYNTYTKGKGISPPVLTFSS